MNELKLTPTERAKDYERYIKLFFSDLRIVIRKEEKYISISVFDKHDNFIAYTYFDNVVTREMNNKLAIGFLVSIENNLVKFS